MYVEESVEIIRETCSEQLKDHLQKGVRVKSMRKLKTIGSNDDAHIKSMSG